ncbi:hypothetical protein [Caballeronia sp. LZ008]|uniref:hypothetical protein n=1 Tax=Caballeronia sp. LZ008 TaxID=3038560 RepID=UPI0038D37D9F
MYLADTNVISETRLEERANEGVRVFFRQAKLDKRCVHLSVMTVAELRQGVERVRRRGDKRQAEKLESWVNNVLRESCRRARRSAGYGETCARRTLNPLWTSS